MLLCYYLCWCLSVSHFGAFLFFHPIPAFNADLPDFTPNSLATNLPMWYRVNGAQLIVCVWGGVAWMEWRRSWLHVQI